MRPMIKIALRNLAEPQGHQIIVNREHRHPQVALAALFTAADGELQQLARRDPHFQPAVPALRTAA